MKSPASILFDVSGIPTAVSASTQPLSGALGQVMAGFDATNTVRYAKFDGDSLKISGSVSIGAIPGTITVTGSVGLNGLGGAATEVTLSSINSKTPSLGQATSANSTPVVLSSDYIVTGTLDNGFVSVSNSSTTPLAGGATFTGAWEDITHYAGMTVIGEADQNGTLFAESSIDGITVDRTTQLSSGAGSNFGIHSLIPLTRYFRVRLVNGASAQSSLRLQTIYSKTPRITIPTSRYNTAITDYTNVINTRSGIVGIYNSSPPTLTSGDRSDVQLDQNGRLIVTLSAPTRDVSTAALSAGSTYTTTTFDTINGQNVVNLSVFSTTDMDIFIDESEDSSNWATINTAAISANLGKNETHVAAARYVRVRYKNGTVANAGGIANLFLATSITTFGNDTNINIADEFGNVVSADKMLGLRVKTPADTETFGAGISQSRISQLQANFSVALANNSVKSATAGSGTATTSNASLLLTTGANTTSSASATTNAVLSYTPGREAYAMFTAAFTTPTSANSNQRIGLYDSNNGFFIGYIGTTFSVVVRQNGTDTTVGQSSFNGDTLQGNTNSRFSRGSTPEAIDLTKKNVFRIRFGWLGAAPVKFEVLSPDGEWVAFHTIRQPNTAANPTIFSTALPIKAEATKSAADTTSLVLNTSSWDAGVVDNTGIDFSSAGSIGALNDTVVSNTSGKATTSINVTGTWSGTLVFEAHNGDANWAAVNAYTTAYSSVANTTTNQFLLVISSAYSQVRVRASAWTSGTATIQMLAANAQVDGLVLPSGAATSANQTTIGNQTTKINDGTSTATIKASSTAALTTDTALVVAVSPNNTVEVNSNASANSGYSPDQRSYVVGTSALTVDASSRLETHSTVTADEGSFRDDYVGSAITRNLTGTLDFTNLGTTVTGTGTSFTTEIKSGDYIKKGADSETNYVEVSEVISDTELLLVTAYQGTTASTTGVVSNWLTVTAATAGSITVASSQITLASGTASGQSTYIKRSADYLPVTMQVYCSVSQRVANQTIFLGFRDNFTSPTKQAGVVFTGTTNTQVNFVTSFGSAAADTQTTTVTLPASATTASLNTYKIDISGAQCSLLINNVVVATHTQHIPGPYDLMDIYYGTNNTAVVTSTNLVVDYMYFYNSNRVQIDNDFQAEPIVSRLSDGTNYSTIKASSTSAGTTDTALVVALSPNNTPFQFASNDRLLVGNDTLALFDTFDGAAVNAVVWTQSQSGMSQSVTGGTITLNSAASTTNGNYSILTSNKSIRYTEENSLNIHFKTRITTFANTVKELGWGTVSTTTAPTNGVFIRVDATGAILGVINTGGTETTTQLVAAGYNSANYLDFNIRIVDTTVMFSVVTNDESTINVTSMLRLPVTTAAVVTSAAQPLFMRVYNSGVAGGGAQIICADVSITVLDNGPHFADYANVTSVAASATNVTLLAANPNRRAVTIFNDSTQVLYVKYGATASTTSFTYRLTANSALELPAISPDGRPWVGQLDGIWAAAVGNARITEVQ